MCDTCGCGSDQNFTIQHREGENDHNHSHNHLHDSKTIPLEINVLNKNNLLAERNRGYFEAKKIKAFNWVSSPGAGKTTLLEKLIQQLIPEHYICVIEGDQQTTIDAERIKKAGAIAIQINTGKGCHLDAHMVNHAINDLNPAENSILFIENVGNLICPALFDLGEKIRISIISTTEGEDKPLKYPDIFQSSQLCIINKIDLLPYLEMNMNNLKSNLKKVNPDIEIITCSAKTGEGIEEIIKILF